MNITIVKTIVGLAIGVAFEATIGTGFYLLGGWMIGDLCLSYSRS